ncbi:translation initiation factor 4E [Schistosoma bovis]|uniref:Translation initiation factor 4E n=2 Tax=Schistosoma TaxID=6181 RepID=A0A430QP74_SCHBO|nr:translation initiation factor 4E [Schistosoma bovis]
MTAVESSQRVKEEKEKEEEELRLHPLQDSLWDELLMLLIGSDWDTDEEDKQICGAVFQPRARGSKLSVWLTSDNEEETIVRIGKRIKERLELEDTIYFQPVSDQRSQTRGRDICTGKYEI